MRDETVLKTKRYKRLIIVRTQCHLVARPYITRRWPSSGCALFVYDSNDIDIWGQHWKPILPHFSCTSIELVNLIRIEFTQNICIDDIPFWNFVALIITNICDVFDCAPTRTASTELRTARRAPLTAATTSIDLKATEFGQHRQQCLSHRKSDPSIKMLYTTYCMTIMVNVSQRAPVIKQSR